MAQLVEQIDQIDGLMKKLVNRSQGLKAKVKALCEVKGVGHDGVTLLITLPELGTLGRNRIVVWWVAPLNDDSGTKKTNATSRADEQALCLVHAGLKRQPSQSA